MSKRREVMAMCPSCKTGKARIAGLEKQVANLQQLLTAVRDSRAEERKSRGECAACGSKGECRHGREFRDA